MRTVIVASLLSAIVGLVGCERSPNPTTPPASAPSTSARKDDHADHDHAHEGESAHKAGHGGDVVDLGATKIGELSVRASRDKDEVKAGSDTPIDVWVATADGKPAPVTAVRLWIGTEDAKGAIKAKGELEDPKEPSHWHAHVEVPNPIPDGSKLCVEIEGKDGKKTVGSFELK